MINLEKLPLHSQHEALKAKFCPFAKFNMPLMYKTIKEESLAVRQYAGLFDVSHMGEFIVTGPDTFSFLHYALPNNIIDPPIGKAIYSPMLNEDGKILDDLIVYKLQEEKALICVNAANIESDWEHLLSVAKNSSFKVELKNASNFFCLLALQGPHALQILKECFSYDFRDMPYYGVQEVVAKGGEEMIVARTGYTGEDGLEIFCGHFRALEYWQKFMAKGVTPAGLAARDLLRLEVCYPLYGNELHKEITPFDSNLKWTVKMDKKDFVGKKALENYTPKFQLLKLSLEHGIPRPRQELLTADNRIVGHVTSGSISFHLGRGIALAHIEREELKKLKEEQGIKTTTELEIFINIRNKKHGAKVHQAPFLFGKTS